MSPRREFRHHEEAIANAIDSLVAMAPNGFAHRDLVREMVTAAMYLTTDGLDRGEIKILNSTLKEFRYAFKVFDRYADRRKVSIFGSARTPPDSAVYQHAKKFAEELARKGFMVITGAGPGIMRAGNEGATRENSFGVNIRLPFEQEPNDIIAGDDKLINFKYFFTRKLSFVKESDAIVLFPGGFGTLDEGFETLTLLQTGKADPLPVVMMDIPQGNYWTEFDEYVRSTLLRKNLISPADLNLYRYTTDIQKAVAEIETFYRNYHSMRYVEDLVIMRLNKPPTPALLERLNEDYKDILAAGARFEAPAQPHPAERNEPPDVLALPRLTFRFVRKQFGRLRRLIDEINLAEL
ncbi:MAG TPA: LOG family protein, partial [Planctomycetota bacterium]|nr:LOG family protein [Planctomycetota bacterium]